MIEQSVYRKHYDNSDIVWKSLRHVENHWDNWGNGAFIGNGQLGAMAFKKSEEGITLELGRNDVEAHNYLVGIDWCYPRVPVGDVVITADGKTVNEDMHLHLYDAFAEGTLTTDRCVGKWEAFCANSHDVFVIRLTKLSGIGDIKLGFFPEHGVSPRLFRVEPNVRAAASPLPPRPISFKEEGVYGWRQPLVNDAGEIAGGFTVAVAEDESENAKIYYISLLHNKIGSDAFEEAVKEVFSAKAVGFDGLFADHLEYWHNYYSKSLLEFSNEKWQKFYDIQMYKLASATREDAEEVIDSQGPWLTKTGWPGTWWNLNVQLSYSPLYTSNHLDIARSLINAMNLGEEQLRKNAAPVCDDGIYIHRSSGRSLTRNTIYTPAQIKAGNLVCFELGNITWIMFTIYRHFRFSMDEKILHKTLFPLLKAAVNVFIAVSYEAEDGRLHLPKTTSPEYPGPFNPKGNSCPWEDTAYDISLFRWGLTTLIELCDEFQIEDTLYTTWKESLDKLCDIPVDETGINVARGMPYEISHRHYSHLFPIFPLHQLNVYDADDRALAERSLNHWQSLPEKLVGYSCTGASCMASTLGDGDGALSYLDRLLMLDGINSYVTPNTMYLEPVGGPVIETPITAAEAIHYMFLQSYGGILRVFPAVPGSIDDVRFENLLTHGAFLVSAERKGGKNCFVKVKAGVDGLLRIKTGLSDDVKYIFEGNVEKADGLFQVCMKKGEEIVFYDGEMPLLKENAI